MTAVKTKPPQAAVTARGRYKNTQTRDIVTESPVELNRTLPHDMEAEQGVLQACLADPEATDRSSEIINPKDFYRRGYAIIFERLMEFRNQKRSYTPTTVLQSFRNHPEYGRIETTIFELAPFITGQTSRHFAKIVKDFSIRRSLINAAVKLATDCFTVIPDIEEIVSDFTNTLKRLRGECNG